MRSGTRLSFVACLMLFCMCACYCSAFSLGRGVGFDGCGTRLGGGEHGACARMSAAQLFPEVVLAIKNRVLPRLVVYSFLAAFLHDEIWALSVLLNVGPRGF